MTINEDGFEFNLSPQKPDEVTVDSLKASLTSLGLTCDETTPDKLNKYITDVKSQLPTGNYQAFAIHHYRDDPAIILSISTGQWVPDPGLKQQAQLQYILRKEIFEWLKVKFYDFPGNVASDNNDEAFYTTVDAIKKAFVTAAIKTSSTLPEPLDSQSMESVIEGWLNILPATDDKNFDSELQSSNIYIALNPDGHQVDAIGAIADDWRLQIQNWKGKSKNNPGKDTTINIQSRSVSYTDINLLDKHYTAAVKQFGHV